MRRFLFVGFLLSAVSLGGFAQGKISGLAYFDYSYNVSRDTSAAAFANTAASGTKGAQAFQFRRIYFTYDYDISEDYTTRFRVEADQASLTSDGKIGVAVKDAFVKLKGVFGQSDLIVGLQQTPAFEISEAVWGYRSLEKTIMDLRGIVPARDLAMALRGKIDEGGTVGYWIMIGDGSNNKPESDKYKRYYAQVDLKPTSTIDVNVYTDYGARANVTDLYTGAKVSNSTLTFGGFLAFTPQSGLRICSEGFFQSTAHGFDTGTSLDSRSGVGFTIFAVLGLNEKLDAVARFDHYDPNTNSAARGDSREYLIGALAWKVHKNLSIIPNALVEMYEQSSSGRTYDAAVTARLTVSWTF